MTPQERQLVDDLFDRLSKLENTPRDPDAASAISQGLRSAPNAVYALVQTTLLQDEALKRAHARIQELEGGEPEPNQTGGFLDSMRDAIFGQNQSRGSVPNVRPPEVGSRPAWNTGQVLQQSQGPGQYAQAPYGQPYGAPQAPVGGGGSFHDGRQRTPKQLRRPGRFRRRRWQQAVERGSIQQRPRPRCRRQRYRLRRSSCR